LSELMGQCANIQEEPATIAIKQLDSVVNRLFLEAKIAS